jgi:hypothetical protein
MIFPEFERFTTKVIFYRIPKNASTSVYKHLGKKNVIGLYEKEVNERADQRIYKNIFETSHVKPKEFKSFNLCDVKDYFSFVIVRNPWDRIVSMYNFSLLNKKVFEECYGLKNKDFYSFCNLIKERQFDKFFIGSNKQNEWIDPQNPPNKIIRFESLASDFAEMVKELNFIGIEPKLPHKNKTKHEHYSSYYNPETIRIISEVFEEDIDTFKYVFEGKKSEKNKPIDGYLKI